MKNNLHDAASPLVRRRDAAIVALGSLRTRVKIGDVTHDRAPGEGGLTRCRTLFIEEGDTADHWRKYGWRIGQFLAEDATVDCMTCLIRAVR